LRWAYVDLRQVCENVIPRIMIGEPVGHVECNLPVAPAGHVVSLAVPARERVLAIDGNWLPEPGPASVGVAWQYSGGVRQCRQSSTPVVATGDRHDDRHDP
jgi:hypothetical protein